MKNIVFALLSFFNQLSFAQNSDISFATGSTTYVYLHELSLNYEGRVDFEKEWGIAYKHPYNKFN
jgi:hypothetical protein